MADVISPPLSISSIVVSLWLAGCPTKSTLIACLIYYGGGGVGVDKHGHTCVDPSKYEDVTQCCFNIGLPPTALGQHWNNIRSSPGVCWESCLHFETRVSSVSGWNRLHSALCRSGSACTAGGKYKPILTQCLLNASVAGAGQYPFNPSQYFMLAVLARYFESWVTAGPLSVTLAHNQRGAKHDTLTQYRANVGSGSWTSRVWPPTMNGTLTDRDSLTALSGHW